MISSWLYNRLVWGNPPANYAEFASMGLEGASGPVLDVGCGSLVFTAGPYAACDLPILMMDLSLGMLQRARARLADPHPRLLLQGDLYDLPFADETFDRVFQFAVAHLFEDRKPVFRELRRVLRPDGRLFLTSLVTGTTVGDLWAKVLHKRGEMAVPFGVEQLVEELDAVDLTCEFHTLGSGAYLTARRS